MGYGRLAASDGRGTGGCLELVAVIDLLYSSEVSGIPKVIDFSLDYRRPGRDKTIYASCTVLRQGKKLVNVAATAWQDDVSKPIATARCHFLLP